MGISLTGGPFGSSFFVFVHSHSNLLDSEKLVYLQYPLKDGSAKNVTEGLSRSGDYYTEDTENLQSSYDHPRLIH